MYDYWVFLPSDATRQSGDSSGKVYYCHFTKQQYAQCGRGVLPGNTKSIEYAVSPSVATITIHCYSAALYVKNAEIKGLGVIVNIPGGFEIRIYVTGRRVSSTSAIEKLNHIVLP